MRWLKQKYIRKLVQRFWGTLILLVLVLAVGVQLGREAFPMLNDYREPLAERVSAALGVKVEIGAIDARWVGLRPSLEFRDVNMRSIEGRGILVVERVNGELSLLNSLWEWRPIWSELEFHQLHMEFEQGDNGQWTLGGINLSRPRVDDQAVQDPLDLFLLSRHLTLNQSTFEFSFRKGHRAELAVPELVLENEDDFHRLATNFAVDGDKEAFSLVVEGHGNPRAEDDFEIAGYVALADFPMEKVVAALDIAAWDAADEGQWSEGHRLDTDLWFSGNPYREVQLKGFLRADGLPLKAPENVQLPAGLQADVTGRWRSGQGWRLALQRAELFWDEFSAPIFNLTLSGAFNRPLEAAVDQIDLATWHALAEQTGLVRGKGQEVLAELAPRGILRNVHIKQRSPENGHFLLRATMEDIQVDAYRNSAAIGSLDGFIEATSHSGRVVIDSRDGFSMFYPNVYHEPMTYSSASGEVRWAVRKSLQRVEVFSGLLSLSGEEGEGRGVLHLVLPFGPKPRANPQMTLLVGLRNSHARFHTKYVPYKVPEALYDWLQQSIKTGNIADAGFLWHGSLVKSDQPPSIQLIGDIDQAELQFSPQWPPLRNARGGLVLDNKTLDVKIAEATLGGNQLNDVAVELHPREDQAPLLTIVGKVRGQLDQTLSLLHNSPVGAHLSGLAKWRGTGQVKATLNLEIPIGGEIGAGHYDVRAALDDAQLTLPQFDVRLGKINGPLHYTSDLGLNSSGLNLTLWGRPATARLETSTAQGQTRDVNIHFTGSVVTDALTERLKQPQLKALVDGIAAIEGHIVIPFGGQSGAQKGTQKGATMEIATNLEGVAIDLPGRYGKSADQTRPLALFAEFADHQLLRVSYDNLVRAQMLVDKRLESASLAFGDSYQSLEPGYFDITGRIHSLQLAEWRATLRDIVGAAPGEPGAGLHNAQNGALTPRFDLTMDQFQFEQLTLEQLYITGEHDYHRWRVDMRSPHLFGELMMYDDGRPVEIDLISLRLPKADGDTAEENPNEPEQEKTDSINLLKRINLGKLPPMNFSTASLMVGDSDYGAWSFDLRPIEGGVALHRLQGRVMGLNFGGSDGDPEGGEMVWLQSRERNSTYIRGQISTMDLSDVLVNLGQPELLESQSARFDLELLWPGAPDDISIGSIEGSVTLAIRDGRFIRGAEAGNNPFLRLFGLLNFDTLARRLKLDFSDLYKEGMVFDSVDGTLQFAKGKVLVSKPLRVRSPSSTLHFVGVLDATTEQLDAKLVATLPMSGNLAVAAAFVGGLPAAVGVYAVSKLFKEQVDRASSIRYQISGSWDDPSIRVDRIFESSTEGERSLFTDVAGDENESVSSEMRGVQPPNREPLSGEPNLETRRPPEN